MDDQTVTQDVYPDRRRQESYHRIWTQGCGGEKEGLRKSGKGYNKRENDESQQGAVKTVGALYLLSDFLISHFGSFRSSSSARRWQ
jgi:hypothetical protein